MIEHEPSSEFSAEELELIEKLREQGLEGSEAREALLAWVDGLEARANEANTPRANIEVDLRKAKLYRAAGFPDEAWASLEAVLDNTDNAEGGMEDLSAEAIAIMNDMNATGA